MRVLLAALLAATALSANAQTLFGSQGQSSPPGGDMIAAAAAVGANAVRIRVAPAHPVYDLSRTGCTTVPQTNVDPAASAPYTVKLSSTCVQVGDTLQSDIWGSVSTGGGQTTVSAVSGFTVTVPAAPIQFVAAVNNYGVVGAGNVVASAQTAGLAIDLTVMNLSASGFGSPAGPIATTDADYRADLLFTLNQVAATDPHGKYPWLVTIENEEDGSGASGNLDTAAQYLQKLDDAVPVVHGVGSKIAGSGVTILGASLAYWDSLYNGCGTPACQITATLFTQLAFSKSSGQFNFSGDLPNQCPGGGGGHISVGHAARLAKANAIIAGEVAAGVDYINLHHYQTPPPVADGLIAWLKSTTHLPVIQNEMGSYSRSVPDLLALMTECRADAMAECIYWNMEGANSAPNDIALANPDGSLRGNGVAFKAFMAGTAPGVMFGAGPGLPSC